LSIVIEITLVGYNQINHRLCFYYRQCVNDPPPKSDLIYKHVLIVVNVHKKHHLEKLHVLVVYVIITIIDDKLQHV
jgi:hypothetical protein